MSRTTITRECRTLSKTLASCSKLHHNTLRHNHSQTWKLARKGFEIDGSKRMMHTRGNLQEHEVRVESMKIEEDRNRGKRLKDDLRALLRDIAQPVAVVTSFMPPNEAHTSSSSGGMTFTFTTSQEDDTNQLTREVKYHGATLSSFTSIAMDPYPLVAFALRIPSRMATTLSSLVVSNSSSSPFLPTKSAPFTSSSHMVINLLSASQASEAITFSRPDLYPAPFTTLPGSKGVEYVLSDDGLPILHGVVGALSCKLVGPPIPLHDLDYFEGRGGKAKEPILGRGDVASELFIARVMRIEQVPSLLMEHDPESTEMLERTLPLVYHRRSYTSCHPRPGRKTGNKS